MSVAKQLPEIEPFFMQDCPLCGRSNRMVVKGVSRYTDDGKTWHKELYPDIGYSFCNCKCIFYTRFENVKERDDLSFQTMENPLAKLGELYLSMESGQNLLIRMPDVFFVTGAKTLMSFCIGIPGETTSCGRWISSVMRRGK